MSIYHDNFPGGFIHVRDYDTFLVYYLSLFEIFQLLFEIFIIFLL